MKDLNNDIKELLKNINICCIKINENKNLNSKFKKLNFLKKENFYENFKNTEFIE